MKFSRVFFGASTILSLCLCGTASAQDDNLTSEVNLPDKGAQVMTGTYTGMFGDRKMTVSIDKIIGNTLTGHSIVSANERAFSGSWNHAEKGGYAILAKEPGDHPYDGQFLFHYDPDSKQLEGEWIANDKKVRVNRVKFTLLARTFKYNPKAGTYPISSARILKEADVENLTQEELRLMRNEIYARHGYCFRLKDMRAHFDQQDWYMPMASDVAENLTETETKNAALIKRYEEYSAEYYDAFGR